MTSPYAGLPKSHFWRTAVAETSDAMPDGLYRKKFDIGCNTPIATAGSCFAQNIARYLRRANLPIIDSEPAPPGVAPEAAPAHGYGLYSARYGNIYTIRHLLQLAQDAFSGEVDARDVWTKDGRFFDALRPNIEPDGFASIADVLAARRLHLAGVRQMFVDARVLIFTLGLTEAWLRKDSGRVYPTAPGTIAGSYDPAIFAFKNLTYGEVHGDFLAFRDLVHTHNSHLKFLLTVSPVPLTATATGDHVLAANMYSKSVMRAAAGALASAHADIDYFPSYEIVANPWSGGRFYEPNLRSVTEEGVETVMRVFFAAHGIALDDPDISGLEGDEEEDEAVCEEILLDAFGR